MNKKIYINLIIFFCIISCNNNANVPKPKGFVKYTFPEKKYETIKLNCPFSFEIPKYSELKKINECNFNLIFHHFNATIYFTYIEINNDLNKHINQTKKYIQTHELKTESISIIEKEYSDNDKKGILFMLQGEVATSRQFFLTDEKKHFIRGALYFNEEINDSIKPIESFITYDIINIIETMSFD